MFCADYIASFIFHAAFNIGIIRQIKTIKSSELEGSNDKDLVRFLRNILQPEGQNFVKSWLFGGLSGFFSACALFPFDFVRRGAITTVPVKFHHSLSVVPYATVFFGLYFSQRDPTSTKSQVLWASISAWSAVLAEVPFDKAKHAMMGSRKTMILANSLFVPFGALILVLYDKALLKYENEKLKQF